MGETDDKRNSWGWWISSLYWYGADFIGVYRHKNLLIVHFKHVQFILCQLYLNKAVLKQNCQKNQKTKLSLCADNIILYIEYPKDFMQKLLELINEFSKVAGYKINIQKSVAFLYTSNEISEKF